jgi:hypothetical protein
MFRKSNFALAALGLTTLLLVSSVATAQVQAKPKPGAAPTAADTNEANSQQASESTGLVAKPGSRSVLVWIKDGNIVAFGLAQDYKDKRLLVNAYQATARARGNKLLLEFLAPLGGGKNTELKAASLLKFEEGTFEAFDGSCGIARGTYIVNNANSVSPSVEISMLHMSTHRRRRSRNRDECNPFGRGSIFR